MGGRVVLVTGVTRYIGSQLAGRLAAHPAVERVIGVDAALPEPAARARMGAADFARVDIRNPLVARVIEAAGVDTVVHASASASAGSSAARTMLKEMNVLGTMQLLAACQRAESIRHLVVRSTAAVYGASSRDPAIFTENTSARSVPAAGPARDAIDIEAYVRGFGRRRPDVRIAVPRLADVIGPSVVTPLTRYFSLSPVVPTVLGRNARLQFVHERDAVAVLEHLAVGDFAGTVNVAGDGVMTMAQAIHRAGRVPLSFPAAGLGVLSQAMRTLRLGGFSPSQVKLLSSGRVLDTTRLRQRAGFVPEFTTIEAFDDFAASLRPVVSAEAVRRIEIRVADVLRVTPEPLGVEAITAGRPTMTAVAESAGDGPSVTHPDPGAAGSAGRPSPVPTSIAPPETGRPRLVGITGDAAGTPRRRRTR